MYSKYICVLGTYNAHGLHWTVNDVERDEDAIGIIMYCMALAVYNIYYTFVDIKLTLIACHNEYNNETYVYCNYIQRQITA